MAVIIKGKSTKEQSRQAKSLKSLRAGEVVPVDKKPAPAPINYVQKLAQRTAVKTNETTSTINNGTIKPKYIQNKDVVYKKSGYVKDLLGEES